MCYYLIAKFFKYVQNKYILLIIIIIQNTFSSSLGEFARIYLEKFNFKNASLALC